MIKHIIILGSSYSTGKRIALDYCNDNLEYEKTINELNRLKGNQFSIATHAILAQSEKWSDVIKTDSFFEGVKLVNDKDAFIKLLSTDKEINAIDIANYILTKLKCTHTRLEKLMYFCYADYLCKYNKKLFNDKIFAFKYGPVIESIYEKYKRSNCEIIETPFNKEYQMSVKSRIMISLDGIKKINSIDETLEKYKNYNTNTLIALTHKNGTPWDINDQGQKPYKEISDTDILKHHKYEVI